MREIERTGDHHLAVEDHDLVVGDLVGGVDQDGGCRMRPESRRGSNVSAKVAAGRGSRWTAARALRAPDQGLGNRPDVKL